jgi:hypothetical protein
MENQLIKIEMHEDGLIQVHVVGNLQELSSMLASAITGDHAFNEVFTQAMLKMVAAQEMERIEEIKKANLN